MLSTSKWNAKPTLSRVQCTQQASCGPRIRLQTPKKQQHQNDINVTGSTMSKRTLTGLRVVQEDFDTEHQTCGAVKVSKRNIVVLVTNGNEKKFVVVGFSRHHVHLTTQKNYKSSIDRFGEYRPTLYGYTALSLDFEAGHKCFWNMLKSIDGKGCRKCV